MAERTAKKRATKTASAKVGVGYFSVTLNGKTVEGTGTVTEVLEQMGRAFASFGSKRPVATQDVSHAAHFITLHVGGQPRALWDSAEAFQASYRRAVMRMHPDKGGTREDWDQLQAAADILKRHHGIA